MKKLLGRQDRPKRCVQKYDEIQATIDQKTRRLSPLASANRCIYGTDANDRMARTSKMNMIMHGDGHGGVHHHDGFINVNGIFEGRFDIVLTNPPFGANVEAGDVILEIGHHGSRASAKALCGRIRRAYKKPCSGSQQPKDKPIASLFELPKGEQNKSRPKSSSSSAVWPCSSRADAWASCCPKASSTTLRWPMCASSAKTAPTSGPW